MVFLHRYRIKRSTRNFPGFNTTTTTYTTFTPVTSKPSHTRFFMTLFFYGSQFMRITVLRITNATIHMTKVRSCTISFATSYGTLKVRVVFNHVRCIGRVKTLTGVQSPNDQMGHFCTLHNCSVTFLLSSHSLSLKLSLSSFTQEALRVCVPPPQVLEHCTNKHYCTSTKNYT